MSDPTIPQDVIDRQVEVVTALQGRVLRGVEEEYLAEDLARASEALSHAVTGLSYLTPVPHIDPKALLAELGYEAVEEDEKSQI